VEEDSEALDTHLAQRIASLRTTQGWSLAELAERSTVSKAMLSKIERGESSPTATVLAKIASAFGLSLAKLLTAPSQPPSRLLPATEQPGWTDPATGYHRRQIYLSGEVPLELVEVSLPAGASVGMPASSYVLTRHVVWVIEGRLVIAEGGHRSELGPGDRLEFGTPVDTEYRNETGAACRYLVVVLHQPRAIVS
jgi:transcriptional regulator with XRE-family HTH domain